MATITEQLTQLQTDKQVLVDNLVAKGVEATSDETFTTLAPKVANIPSGGDMSEYFNTEIGDNQQIWYYVIKKLPKLTLTSSAIINYMFVNCYSLEECPEIEMPNQKRLDGSRMFCNCKNLKNISNITKINLPISSAYEMFYSAGTSNNYELDIEPINSMDFSKCSDTSYMFSYTKIKNINLDIDTSNATEMREMFNSSYIESITLSDKFDCGKVRSIYGVIGTNTNYNLKIINGCFKNLGKAFTSTTENYYELNLRVCPNLTHDSLMNIINGLYDLNLTYDVANGGTLYRQKLDIGSTNLAKLTEEEIAIATNKGWNVS